MPTKPKNPAQPNKLTNMEALAKQVPAQVAAQALKQPANLHSNVLGVDLAASGTLTEGTKYDSDKPDYSLLSSYSIDELAKVLSFGAKKYAPHNWRKGIKTTRLLAAALRHVFAYLRGENTDPETGLSHLSHAMCCLMFAIEQDKFRAYYDDRYTEFNS